MGVEHLDEIHVIGGNCLKGSIKVQGSKNTVLPVMAASLLQSGICVLRGCPRISDVLYMEEILKLLGAKTWWEDHDLFLDCGEIRETEIPLEYTGRMRCSVILLGALLGRMHRGVIGYPGGCVIGRRPIDMHLHALECFGVSITEEAGEIHASCGKLRGNEIIFANRSVGATEQALLASVLAEGETVIRNCAEEPEILWLCSFLRKMGGTDQWRRRRMHPGLWCRDASRGRNADPGRQDRDGNLFVCGSSCPRNCHHRQRSER